MTDRFWVGFVFGMWAAVVLYLAVWCALEVAA